MYSKSLLFTVIAVFALSCTRNNYYEHQLLTTLPTNSSTQNIDVFYEGESSPVKDYIEYYDLRLVKKGNFNDEQMVNFLKAEAKKKGLDGISHLHKWDESEESASFFDVLATITDPDDDYTTIVNYSIIEGKGIKYIDNIDLSQSLKTGRIYEVESNRYVGEIKYLPNGLIAETVSENDESQEFLDTYFKFSEDHLLYEQKGWQTLHRPDGRIDVRRKYRMNDWVLERVRVNYDAQHNQRIKSIRLTESPAKSATVSKVKYSYDAQNRPVVRKISGAHNFTETTSYEDNKIKETRINYMAKTYKVVYDFYQQSDLKDLITKVEDVKTDR